MQTENAKKIRGGSLCEISNLGPILHKYYQGEIDRGHEKLLKEKLWFDLVPASVRRKYPKLFPALFLAQFNQVSELEDSLKTSLYVERLDRIALSKAITFNQLKYSEAVAWFEVALQILIETVYSFRTARNVISLYSLYHRPRLQLASDAFKQDKFLSHFFDDGYIVINNLHIPKISTFLHWLETEKVQHILESNQLVCVHGNLHPDNILIAFSQSVSRHGVTLIDPRGDLLGPLYYDVAKIMTSLHSKYDEIHYDRFTLVRKKNGYELTFDESKDQVYSEMLKVMNRYWTEWAYISKDSIHKIVQATLIVEALHTLSLSFYHYKRKNPDLKRVEAYLLVATWLAYRAYKKIDGDHNLSGVYDNRLVLQEI